MASLCCQHQKYLVSQKHMGVQFYIYFSFFFFLKCQPKQWPSLEIPSSMLDGSKHCQLPFQVLQNTFLSSSGEKTPNKAKIKTPTWEHRHEDFTNPKHFLWIIKALIPYLISRRQVAVCFHVLHGSVIYLYMTNVNFCKTVAMYHYQHSWLVMQNSHCIWRSETLWYYLTIKFNFYSYHKKLITQFNKQEAFRNSVLVESSCELIWWLSIPPLALYISTIPAVECHAHKFLRYDLRICLRLKTIMSIALLQR